MLGIALFSVSFTKYSNFFGVIYISGYCSPLLVIFSPKFMHFLCIFMLYGNFIKSYKSNPRLKGNRKGILVKDKEFYIPILDTFPTR